MLSDEEIEAAREAWRKYWCEEDVPRRNTRDGITAALEAAARVRAEDNAGEPVEEACNIFLVSAMVEKPGMAGHRARVGRFASKEEAIGSSLELWQVDGWSVRSYECAPCNNLLFAPTSSKPEQAVPSGKVDARIENTDGKKWRVESNDGKWTIQPEGQITADEARALCKRILSALTAGKPEQSGWQPIETAPKDGTWVMLWRGHTNFGCWGPLVIGKWLEWRWVWPDGPYNPYTETGREDADLDIACGCHHESNEFTHWMPLPTPPTAGGGDA